MAVCAAVIATHGCEYRLVRVLGNVIGLGWSQVNLNVITGKPPPTSDDRAGFPVMHNMELFSCMPITACYAIPTSLRPTMWPRCRAVSCKYVLGKPRAAFTARFTCGPSGQPWPGNAGRERVSHAGLIPLLA